MFPEEVWCSLYLRGCVTHTCDWSLYVVFLFTLPRCNMSVKMSQTTENSIACCKGCSKQYKYQASTKHYWPFVKVMYRWPLDSPHKGHVMWKVCTTCHQAISLSFSCGKGIKVNICVRCIFCAEILKRKRAWIPPDAPKSYQNKIKTKQAVILLETVWWSSF